MSQKKRRKRHAAPAHQAPSSPPQATQAWYPHSLFEMLHEQAQRAGVSMPLEPAPATHNPTATAAPHPPSPPVPPARHPLEIMLEPAVVLHVLEFFERGGPSDHDVEAARTFGQILASKGDHLLYRSSRPGETAELFNGLARAIAVLAHAPGGVPLFGKRLDAEQIVASFAGRDAATRYIREYLGTLGVERSSEKRQK